MSWQSLKRWLFPKQTTIVNPGKTRTKRIGLGLEALEERSGPTDLFYLAQAQLAGLALANYPNHDPAVSWR